MLQAEFMISREMLYEYNNDADDAYRCSLRIGHLGWNSRSFGAQRWRSVIWRSYTKVIWTSLQTTWKTSKTIPRLGTEPWELLLGQALRGPFSPGRELILVTWAIFPRLGPLPSPSGNCMASSRSTSSSKNFEPYLGVLKKLVINWNTSGIHLVVAILVLPQGCCFYIFWSFFFKCCKIHGNLRCYGNLKGKNVGLGSVPWLPYHEGDILGSHSGGPWATHLGEGVRTGPALAGGGRDLASAQQSELGLRAALLKLQATICSPVATVIIRLRLLDWGWGVEEGWRAWWEREGKGSPSYTHMYSGDSPGALLRLGK